MSYNSEIEASHSLSSFFFSFVSYDIIIKLDNISGTLEAEARSLVELLRLGEARDMQLTALPDSFNYNNK